VVSARIYVEGGATGDDSKESKIRCQEAFHKFLARMGFTGRKPRLVACGGRAAVYSRLVTAHSQHAADYVAMWIDSEDALNDLEEAWAHLKARDGWAQPAGATNEQVLFMTTCMEAWIVADRAALRRHYGSELQETALPPLTHLESRNRHEIHDQLRHATRKCANAYAKGKRSFDLFGALAPAVLEEYLPSFVRIRRILNARL
jgi:hypothetical protein